MPTGSVARFDVRRGYGFVIPDDGGEDVFVHQNNILMEGFRFLKSGEKVSFELEVGEKGMKAVQVQLLEPRPPEPERGQRSNNYQDRDDRRGNRGRKGGNANNAQGGNDKVARKLERLISLLVDKGTLAPGDIDAIENGLAAVTANDDYEYDDDYDDDYEDED